jgi:hypothetical protein
MTMLAHAYAAGRAAAFGKFALSPPTGADNFVAQLDRGKDMPPDQVGQIPEAPPMPLPAPGTPGNAPDPCESLGAKAAALGLKDMLFFENMMGPEEAKSMFQDVHNQMSGQGGGRRGTLNIGPGGPQFQPHAPAPAAAARPPIAPRPAAPPPVPGQIISSAPAPTMPRLPRR